jgi:hypothetical protein
MMRTLTRQGINFVERLVFGGRLREAILIRLLSGYYHSQFRRQWRWSTEQPHFEDQRVFFFDFAFSKPPIFTGASPFYRGFFASEVIRDGDLVLDIGSGDGFFSMRFLSERASHVDALDIDSSAISLAKKENFASNVQYHCSDAIIDPFPKDLYDVICWDGALGHFSAQSAARMLTKFSRHLHPQGIFIGSESLGSEGHDHLQFFESLDDVGALFKPYFRYVCLRQINYPLPWARGFVRKEAFWRCSNHSERLESLMWKIGS